MKVLESNRATHDPAVSLRKAQETAEAVSKSSEYRRFLETVRKVYPWRFNLRPDILERDYLRIVDHHLRNLVPRMQRYMNAGIRQVLDFGCGSGGSAIALGLVYPRIQCQGTDIDDQEIFMAQKRAKVYDVSDRCEFHHVAENQPLPFPDNSFDLVFCSSVLEYATEEGARKFCVQEMARLAKPGGMLFFSVPNRLYPFEIHTGKWGWNYFPGWLKARTVDTTFWEVRKLARPIALRLERTPVVQLLRPWSNFCLRKEIR